MAKRRTEPPPPRSERTVNVGGVGMRPGQKIRMNGHWVRVTDDGVAEIRGLLGWRPLKQR